MKAVAEFPRVERCPDDPNAITLTGTGYIRNGVHYRTVPRAGVPLVEERRGVFGWLFR